MPSTTGGRDRRRLSASWAARSSAHVLVPNEGGEGTHRPAEFLEPALDPPVFPVELVLADLSEQDVELAHNFDDGRRELLLDCRGLGDGRCEVRVRLVRVVGLDGVCAPKS